MSHGNDDGWQLQATAPTATGDCRRTETRVTVYSNKIPSDAVRVQLPDQYMKHKNETQQSYSYR